MPDVTVDWNAGRTQEQKDKIAKVIENAEGARTTPSMVAFPESKEKHCFSTFSDPCINQSLKSCLGSTLGYHC